MTEGKIQNLFRGKLVDSSLEKKSMEIFDKLSLILAAFNMLVLKNMINLSHLWKELALYPKAHHI